MKKRTLLWLLITLFVFGAAFKWPFIIKYLTISISVVSIILSLTVIYKIFKNNNNENE